MLKNSGNVGRLSPMTHLSVMPVFQPAHADWEVGVTDRSSHRKSLYPRSVSPTGGAALKTHALQTLRDLSALANLAQRLEQCD